MTPHRISDNWRGKAEERPLKLGNKLFIPVCKSFDLNLFFLETILPSSALRSTGLNTVHVYRHTHQGW